MIEVWGGWFLAIVGCVGLHRLTYSIYLHVAEYCILTQFISTHIYIRNPVTCIGVLNLLYNTYVQYTAKQ